MRRTSLVLLALVVAHGLPTRHRQSARAAESTERRIARSLDAELDGLLRDLAPDGNDAQELSGTPDAERNAVWYGIDSLAKEIHGKTALGKTRCEYMLVDKAESWTRTKYGQYGRLVSTGDNPNPNRNPDGYNCDQWTYTRIPREQEYLPLPKDHSWYQEHPFEWTPFGVHRVFGRTARKCRVPVTRKYDACPKGKFCAYNSDADAANNFRFATGRMRDMFRDDVIEGYCKEGVAPGMWEHEDPECTGTAAPETGTRCRFKMVDGSPDYWKQRGIDRP